jgi:hypothetical protein
MSSDDIQVDVAETSSQPLLEESDNPNITLELDGPADQPPAQDSQIADENVIPRMVFIVPYREREQHYRVFSKTMAINLAKSEIPYKIFYIHQTDNRGFNRGAMKNIGFLFVKQMYPDNYKKMTLVFNDIDTVPTSNTHIPYETTTGNIKHFYGFEHTLGGIVSITGEDFERLNGFPNFWAWGYEDNLLQIRAQHANIHIDRSVFYKIGNPTITRLQESNVRNVNRTEYDRFVNRTLEGISSICDLEYTLRPETGFVDVSRFNTNAEEIVSQRKEYDLKNGPAPFKNSRRNRREPTMRMLF